MRRRIAWLVAATTSAVIASFVIPLCLLVRTLAEDRAVAAADQEARNVALLVAGLADDPQLAQLVNSLDSRARPATGVLMPGGRWYGSGDRPTADEVTVAKSGRGVTHITGEQATIVLPVVLENGTAVVKTYVGEAELRRGVPQAWAGILGLGLVLFLLAVAVAARLGRAVSEPLLAVTGVAHRLREGELSARADVRGTVETEELGRALNGLAERTTELLALERAAVGDLSHRLRTPVTALRLDAESVPEPGLAARLQEHIAVLQRTIDAIVREARRPVRTDLAAACDAVWTVRQRTLFWSALAEDQGRPMEVDLAEGPLVVAVAADDLADLVDVLVDNVFAHTPEHTGFRISLTCDEQQVRLVVSDDGGEPPAGPRDPVGRTGLGLDIARRTALAAGGSLDSRRDEAGTEVSVVLPLRPDLEPAS